MSLFFIDNLVRPYLWDSPIAGLRACIDTIYDVSYTIAHSASASILYMIFHIQLPDSATASILYMIFHIQSPDSASASIFYMIFILQSPDSAAFIDIVYDFFYIQSPAPRTHW